MKHTTFLFVAVILLTMVGQAQNVGIGTTTPGTTLSVRKSSLGFVMENSAATSNVIIKTEFNRAPVFYLSFLGFIISCWISISYNIDVFFRSLPLFWLATL